VREMMEGNGLLLEVDEIGEKFRRQPYSLIFNNCLIKSIRFARECKRLGIPAKVVLSLGLASARMPRRGRRIAIPALHCWGEVNGNRIEVAHPLGRKGMLNIDDGEIKPILRLRL
jgi:transglutaminase-like putative cysteine protease